MTLKDYIYEELEWRLITMMWSGQNFKMNGYSFFVIFLINFTDAKLLFEKELLAPEIFRDGYQPHDVINEKNTDKLVEEKKLLICSHKTIEWFGLENSEYLDKISIGKYKYGNFILFKTMPYLCKSPNGAKSMMNSIPKLFIMSQFESFSFDLVTNLLSKQSCKLDEYYFISIPKIDSPTRLTCYGSNYFLKNFFSPTAYIEYVPSTGDCGRNTSMGYKWGPKNKGDVEKAPCVNYHPNVGYMTRRCLENGEWSEVDISFCFVDEYGEINKYKSRMHTEVENDEFVMYCPAQNNAITWFHNNETILFSERIKIKNDGRDEVLRIFPVLQSDAGVYKCQSSTIYTQELSVHPQPKFHLTPSFKKVVNEFQRVNFTILNYDFRMTSVKCLIVEKTQAIDLFERNFSIIIDSPTTLNCSLFVPGKRPVFRTQAYVEYAPSKGDCGRESSVGYEWGPKNKGDVEKAPCDVKNPDQEYMTRKCLGNGEWDAVDISYCSKYKHENMDKKFEEVYDEENHLDGNKMKEMAEDLNTILDNPSSNETNNEYDYVNLLYKLAESRKTADDDYEDYIKKGKNTDVESFKEEMKNMVMCIAKVTKKILPEENICNKTCSIQLLKTINVYANTRLYQPDFEMQFGNITFERKKLEENIEEASFPDWSQYQEKRQSKISLLSSFFEKRKDSVNYYASSSYSEDLAIILDTNRNDSYINSGLISLDIAIEKEDLKEMNGEDFIECTIEHLNPIKEGEQSQCVFWNFDSGGYWSSEGCTVTSSTKNETVCKCNHLTNFAVLISPHQNLSESNKRVLRIISLVGCIISIIALIFTFIYYAFMWKQVKSKRLILVLNLCFALLIANILLLIEFAVPDSIKAACTALAVLLHFFFLAAFFAMLAISMHLMISVFFVFFVFTKKCTIILLLFSWVCPLIIVVTSIAVTRLDGYGTELHCWLSLKEGLLWAFVGPAVLIILFNLVVVLAVIISINKTNNLKNDDRKNKLKSSARNIFILNPLLGLTWIFGVLSVNEHLIVFQYIFTIVNSIQGVFIFILYALCYESGNKKVRKPKIFGYFKGKKIHDASTSINKTSNNGDSETFITINSKYKL